MTNLLLKSGNCFGLSNVVNKYVNSFKVIDLDSFKKLTKILGQTVPQRILTKENLNLAEKRLEKHLRMFINWKNHFVSLELLTKEDIKKQMKIDITDCVNIVYSFRFSGFINKSLRDFVMFVIQQNLENLNNLNLRKVLESFSKGNLDYNFFKEFYLKSQFEVTKRKHMFKTSQLIDSLFYISSYGSPSIDFLQQIGNEILKRELSIKNFQHLNRLMESMIILKTYFRDPLFIQDEDKEWKQGALKLIETYENILIKIISPIFVAQNASYKLYWFNPKLYIENFSHLIFLNKLFNQNLISNEILENIFPILTYHCLWFAFYLHNKNKLDSNQKLISEFGIENEFENIFLIEDENLNQNYMDESDNKDKDHIQTDIPKVKPKLDYIRKMPKQLDLDDLIKICFTAEKYNSKFKSLDYVLDFLSSNILRLGNYIYYSIIYRKKSIWQDSSITELLSKNGNYANGE